MKEGLDEIFLIFAKNSCFLPWVLRDWILSENRLFCSDVSWLSRREWGGGRGGSSVWDKSSKHRAFDLIIC